MSLKKNFIRERSGQQPSGFLCYQKIIFLTVIDNGLWDWYKKHKAEASALFYPIGMWVIHQ